MQQGDETTTSKKRIIAITGWIANRPLLADISLVALTVLFGMQTLRVLVPGLFWVLGGRMGWGAIELGGVGLLVFLTAFLAGPLRRLSGYRRLIMVTAGGLGLLRLVMQIWWSEPLFNLCIAMIGTALFVIFLPTYLENARLRGGSAISRFALGLLVGLILDTAINGGFGTYDTSWQIALLPILLTLVLVVIQWLLLANVIEPPSTIINGVTRLGSLTWLAIGPFLFLHLIVFENIPRVAALTNWPLPIAFGYVLLAQLAGLAAATWFLSKLRRTLWPWALGSGAGLILILALSYPQTTALTNLLLLIGQVLLSLLIAVVLIGIMASSKETQHSGIAVANGIGMLLLLMFILAYYAVYDISLPYSNVLLEPIAAFIIAICAIGVPIALHHEIKADHKVWAVPVLTLILLIVPIAGIITWQPPAAAPGKGFPIRIMTYNLHNGFNADGYLDMESLAQVIEDSNPDIVALQEVSRGWVVNGRFDMITWLSHRLDMPYVFGPTTGPLWGNAILSRYPILGYTQRDLPPRDLFLLRGLTVALIDLGNDTRLKVVATHFHHLDGDTDIRQLQAGVTLDFLAGADRTVLLGDFNAHANDREMEMFRQAGLVDTAAALDPAPACTFPSTNPQKRIDYIWLSTDLKVNCIQVPVSNASDHLPVIAVIDE